MMEPVRIDPYDAGWPAAYDRELTLLTTAFGPYALAIEHVGSTSVPGLAAKPIIDIAVAIPQYPLPEEIIENIKALGYEHRGEAGIPRRHYFRKGVPQTHHVHVIELNNIEWRDFILFRDYLRTHPENARAYEALKRRLAQEHEHDRNAYTDAKTDFVKSVIEMALTQA